METSHDILATSTAGSIPFQQKRGTTVKTNHTLLLALKILQLEIRLMTKACQADIRYLDNADEESWRLAEDF